MRLWCDKLQSNYKIVINGGRYMFVSLMMHKT